MNKIIASSTAHASVSTNTGIPVTQFKQNYYPYLSRLVNGYPWVPVNQPYIVQKITIQPLQNNVNILNKALDNINNESILPLEDFQNSVVSPNNIRLDQVVGSLNAFTPLHI